MLATWAKNDDFPQNLGPFAKTRRFSQMTISKLAAEITLTSRPETT
jgi:hypothetical protein